ncbi:hypothetical protein SCB49_13715 [unidentified eubacterium SCB49]|nr:hypothetical protein SCB49_13715 [unidentified eubacterium SCB49]
MTTFISIVIIIIVVAYFIGKNKSTQSTTPKKKLNPSPKIVAKKSVNKEENLLYKQKGIKTFEVKGMFYQKLNPETDDGVFVGIAKCKNNSHDKYAVGIYNKQNKLLGYTPKGNKRLNFSLREWHSGTLTVWGHLRHDDYNDKWYGTVYLPIGYTLEQIEKLELVLKLKLENENQIRLKEKVTEKYFEILSKHRKISSLLADLKNPEELYYSFPRNLIPTISSHLEKEKNWEKLIELEKHQDLINDLSAKFKETTLRRISIAKENVA